MAKCKIVIPVFEHFLHSRNALSVWIDALKDHLSGIADITVLSINDPRSFPIRPSDDLIEKFIKKIKEFGPFDLALCSSYEGSAAANFCVKKTIVYAHDWYLQYSIKWDDKLSYEYIKDFRSLCKNNNIFVGVQTFQGKKNVVNLGCSPDNVVILPMFFPISESYNIEFPEREGILWSGWLDSNDIKGFNILCHFAPKQSLIKVLTNEADSYIIRNILESNGFRTDVRFGLSGEEKIKFISSSEYALLTSKIETFGMFAAEAGSRIPTYYVKKKPWMDHHIRYFDIRKVGSERSINSLSLEQYNIISFQHWRKYLERC